MAQRALVAVGGKGINVAVGGAVFVGNATLVLLGATVGVKVRVGEGAVVGVGTEARGGVGVKMIISWAIGLGALAAIQLIVA
jgi:carbonic anhydrase/acetyltransferase-like protein (isoleucine patch superfamily)